MTEYRHSLFTPPREVCCSEHQLGTGTLSLRVDERLETAPAELFRIAERQNPKRAFLFVSTVLGRHIPVTPSTHRKALDALAEEVMSAIGVGEVLVMSYAETAVGLGLGVFEAIVDRSPRQPIHYLPTTRSRTRGVDVWLETSEAHSHAVDHMVLSPRPGTLPANGETTLVLVDDETTTGGTFQDLAAALHRAGVEIDRVVLATLTDWSGGKCRQAIERVMPQASVSCVSLLSGRYAWSPFSRVLPRALPTRCARTTPHWSPEPDVDFGVPRTGISALEMQREKRQWSDLINVLFTQALTPGSRVLVIGTGEHVWHPFLAAEQLEREGFDVGFISTTRSPVMKGTVIKHQLSFGDHYGLGVWMYLNNVHPESWDEILLITETSAAGIPSELRSALGKGMIMDGAGTVVPMMSAEAS